MMFCMANATAVHPKKASLCLVSSERLIFLYWMEVVFEKVISIEEKRCLSVSFIIIPLNDFKTPNENAASHSNRHLLKKTSVHM